METNTMEMTDKKYEKATFSGGCFWCMEPPFDNFEGVISTTVGYTGGKEKNPNYHEVCYGMTEHLESIEVVYDPERVSYESLLDVFWLNVDPTDGGGQFVDRGRHYKTAIFYHNEGQRKTAEESKRSSGVREVWSPYRDGNQAGYGILPRRGIPSKYYEKNPSVTHTTRSAPAEGIYSI
jgi:methionine-S-sulfoxide reductase